MVQTGPTGMSGYERKAWQVLIGDAVRDEGSGRFEELAGGARERLKRLASQTGQAARLIPGADQVLKGLDATIQKALAGLHTVFVERGLNSVSPQTVFASFAREGAAVSSYGQIRDLDLKFCDLTMPRRKDRYLLLAAGQGAATSAAVTGATVSSTVTGGTTLAIAVGAVAADVTAVMVGMGRIVALVAAHYGYDVREPEEQVFASGVLTYSTATNAAEKAASLAALSRLTQEMMRRATWAQLSRHQLVNIIQKVVSSLGFSLTKKKLAQAVPIVGVAVNGGLNAWFAHSTFKRAQQAYRLRFLTEKYGLDPAVWSPDVIDVDATDIPMVDEIVDAELALAADVDGRAEPIIQEPEVDPEQNEPDRDP